MKGLIISVLVMTLLHPAKVKAATTLGTSEPMSLEQEIINLKAIVRSQANDLQQNYFDQRALTSYVLKGHVIEFAPQAILYGTKSEEGYVYVQDYNMLEPLNMTPECNDLITVNENVESINTFGSCVRLYQGTGCTGANLFYVGYYKNIKDSFGPLRSIGPCQNY